MRKFLSILGISVFLFSCKKEATVWDSDWVVPIINDSLSINHFVNDSTLSLSGSGTYELTLHRTLLDLNLSDVIGIPDTTIHENYTIPFNSLNVVPGMTFIGSNIPDEHVIELQDVQLKKVRIKKGFIDLKLQNPIGTKTFFTVTLPGVKKDGVDLTHIYVAPAGTLENPGVVTESVDISGYEMDLRGFSGASYNILQSLIIVKSDPEGPTVVVTNQYVTKLDATIRDIQLDYAKGYFGNTIISEESEFNVDALQHITEGSVDFPGSQLKLSISNGLKVPAKITLQELKSTNYNNNAVSLSSSQMNQPLYLDAATGTWDNINPGIAELEFNSQNSNLEQYLENLGAKNKVSYALQLNPWGNVSGSSNEFFPDSRLKLFIDAEMPMTIGMNGLTLQDTFDFDLSQDENKTHVTSGKLILNAQNAFPFDCTLIIYLLREDNSIVEIISSPQKLTSSLYGNANSQGILVYNSELSYEIPSSVIVNLDQVKKIAVKAQLNTPNPANNQNEQVMIPENAFISLKMKASFRLNTRIK